MKRLVWMLLDSVTREHSMQTFCVVTIYQANGQTVILQANSERNGLTSHHKIPHTCTSQGCCLYMIQIQIYRYRKQVILTFCAASRASQYGCLPVKWRWPCTPSCIHVNQDTQEADINYANVRRGLPRHRLVSPWLISAAGDSGPEESYRVRLRVETEQIHSAVAGQ